MPRFALNLPFTPTLAAVLAAAMLATAGGLLLVRPSQAANE